MVEHESHLTHKPRINPHKGLCGTLGVHLSLMHSLALQKPHLPWQLETVGCALLLPVACKSAHLQERSPAH